jgi:YbgC/YbaW family acyl-CoA thioester hydrolase
MPFVWKDRIHFVDTDASSRIHYSSIFRHLETAEVEFFRSIGLDYQSIFDAGFSVPRVHVEADYLAPLGHDDEIDIEVRLERLGDSSLTLAFEVRRAADASVAVRARYVMVCILLQTGRATPIPEGIRQALASVQDE